MRFTLAITLSAALGSNAAAGSVPAVIPGELTVLSNAWNRVTDSGFLPGPCGAATALDSVNNGQPFDEFLVVVIDPALPVSITMRSLEATPAAFDPFVALYCDSFVPSTPGINIFMTNDDGGAYPDASMNGTLESGRVYHLVASSYASYAPARYGRYELTITNATVRLPCLVDLNGDGILDNGDITTFVSLFLAGSLGADLNGDGILDNGDITTFVSLFLAGC